MGTFEQGMRRTRFRGDDTKGKRGLAFVVEALILLAFLAGSIAVFMQLFGSAAARGTDAVELDDAVMLATNVAEYFIADPAAVPAEFEEGPYTVRNEVARSAQPAGVLYSLTVSVRNQSGEELYVLQASRYLGDEEAAASVALRRGEA